MCIICCLYSTNEHPLHSDFNCSVASGLLALRYAPMNTSSFCDKNLGLRTSAHSAIWLAARSNDVDGDRLGSDWIEWECVFAECVGFKTAFIVCTFCYLSLSHRLFLSTASLQTLTHTRTHRMPLTARTHTLADRSGRGKANEFTQKKLHNALRYFYETCSFLFVVSSFLLFLSDAQGTTTTTTTTIILRLFLL